MDIKFVGRYFYSVVTIFSKKNRAILVQKFWEKKVDPFSAIFRQKKIRWPLNSRGERGKALMAWPLVKKLFFCGFPKRKTVFKLWSKKKSKVDYFYYFYQSQRENSDSYTQKNQSNNIRFFLRSKGCVERGVPAP